MNLRNIALTIATAFALTGCQDRIDNEERLLERGDQFGDINFSGYALDGVTGRVIEGYELELLYATTTRKAKVDRNTHRFNVEGLPEAQDYAVRITAAGYRPFESSNAAYNFTTEDEEFAGGDKNFVFVAYLYPTMVAAPDTTVNVFLGDATTRASSGSVRLTPTADLSNLETGFVPVGSQVWRNTLDQLTGSQTVAISNGVATFPGSGLVFGVTYNVDVFGVPGYKRGTGSVAVGSSLSTDVTVTTNSDQALELVYMSNDIYRGQVSPSTAVSLTFVFNRQIEHVPNSLGNALNTYDAASNFNVPDTDADGDVVALADRCVSIPDSDAECGWTIAISGNTLTLTGTRSLDIVMDDTGDRVSTVRFASLNSILIRPVGATFDDLDTSVGALAGNNISVAIQQF